MCHHETGQGHGPCSAKSKRNADIVRATAGHGKNGWLKHTIRVVGKVQDVSVEISTHSDPGAPSCEQSVDIRRGQGRPGKVRPCIGSDAPTGRARYDFHRHSVEIFFSERSIGGPQSYGWSASATDGGCSANNCVGPAPRGDPSPHADDVVPNERHRYIRHRLGDSGVAATGVMALGAQTAVSGVDNVPPDLKLFGPKRQDPQNDFHACDGNWCDLVVRVSCGHQKCTARVKGRLTNVRNDRLKPEGPWVVTPGHKGCCGPELTDSQRRQVRRALRRGEKVRAKVTVRAKDAAGNVATAKRTIRLVKDAPGFRSD